MASTLVTGATGFIGRHLVDHLLREGHRVRWLDRRAVDASRYGTSDAERMPGDVLLPETLDRAVRSVDVVYHLAGATSVISERTYSQINIVGTRNLVAACARQPSPPTLVYVSSLAAAGPAPKGEPLDESRLAAPVSEYGRSKLGAERALREYADRVPITVLRPPSIFGPREPHFLKMFKLIRTGINPIPGKPFELSFLYIDDLIDVLPRAVVSGQRLSATQADSGLYFVAGQEWATLEEIGGLVAGILGCGRVRSFSIPRWLCYSMGLGGELAGKMLRKPFLIGRDRMREAFAGEWKCRSDRAIRDLGFRTPIPLAERLRQTAAWYIANGWLKGTVAPVLNSASVGHIDLAD